MQLRVHTFQDTFSSVSAAQSSYISRYIFLCQCSSEFIHFKIHFPLLVQLRVHTFQDTFSSASAAQSSYISRYIFLCQCSSEFLHFKTHFPVPLFQMDKSRTRPGLKKNYSWPLKLRCHIINWPLPAVTRISPSVRYL